VTGVLDDGLQAGPLCRKSLARPEWKRTFRGCDSRREFRGRHQGDRRLKNSHPPKLTIALVEFDFGIFDPTQRCPIMVKGICEHFDFCSIINTLQCYI